MNRPHVSIILPTFKREELLCQTLTDLLRLHYPVYDIIVIDQTPLHRPETQTYLDGVRERIFYLRQEKPSVVAAANLGVQAARGEIALFVDDDIRIPDPEFLTLHVQRYEDATIGGVAGRVLDAKQPQEGRFDPRSSDPLWGFFHTGWDHQTACEVFTAPGANMSFRRDLILRLGRFDTRLCGNAFRWENDFCLRLNKAGHRVVYDPKPTILHFYGSAGGNENRHLYGRDPASHAWYRDFFHNHVYITLKHMPRSCLSQFLWRLYRGHVLNRPYVREGIPFVLSRHRAFVEGLADGWVSYRQWRREKREPEEINT